MVPCGVHPFQGWHASQRTHPKLPSLSSHCSTERTTVIFCKRHCKKKILQEVEDFARSRRFCKREILREESHSYRCTICWRNINWLESISLSDSNLLNRQANWLKMSNKLYSKVVLAPRPIIFWSPSVRVRARTKALVT